MLRGRWPYWLFPIATLHGTRLVRRNVQNDHEYGSFYTVHTADAATARPRHAATERIRALPSRGFGLDGCPRFTLLFTASQLLSRFTGLGCRVQARGRSSPNCDKHTDNAPAQRTVKSVSVLRRKPRVARRTAANRHPDSPGIWRAPSRQRVGVRSRRTARPSWRSGGTD